MGTDDENRNSEREANKGLGMLRVSYCIHLLRTLEAIGVNPAEVYDQAWLAEVSQLSTTAYRPVEEWDRMMAKAESHIGGIDIALKMAEVMRPLDTGAVGFFTMSCATLREAAYGLVQFCGVLNDVCRVSGGVEGNRFSLELTAVGPVRSIYLERLTLATIIEHARWLCGQDGLAMNASFTFDKPAPERLQLYQKMFGGHLVFGAPRASLEGPAAYADLPVAASPVSVQVQGMLRAQLMAELEEISRTNSSFIHRVERALQARLERGETALEDVAAELGVSSRTLQSRVEEAGLSYRALLDRMRHAQALVYLADPAISLIQAAQMLGFSSQSAFQRAFKRWTDVTPGQYRRRHCRP